MLEDILCYYGPDENASIYECFDELAEYLVESFFYFELNVREYYQKNMTYNKKSPIKILITGQQIRCLTLNEKSLGKKSKAGQLAKQWKN